MDKYKLALFISGQFRKPILISTEVFQDSDAVVINTDGSQIHIVSEHQLYGKYTDDFFVVFNGYLDEHKKVKYEMHEETDNYKLMWLISVSDTKYDCKILICFDKNNKIINIPRKCMLELLKN